MARCPREGTEVVFEPNPAAFMTYTGTPLTPGARGRVVSLPVPGGQKTCFGGPRGGMVYVEWAGGRVEGVFRNDLRLGKGKKRRVAR